MVPIGDKEVRVVGQIAPTTHKMVKQVVGGNQVVAQTYVTLEESFTCVSTHDELEVNLRIAEEVIILPNVLTKVTIKSEESWSGHTYPSRELIIQLNRNSPEGLIMDETLIRDSGEKLITFVINQTDKAIHLMAGNILGKGQILGNRMLNIDEQTYLSFTGNKEDKNLQIIKELNKLDFPERSEQLVNLLEEFREVVAIKGDKLGRTSIVEHEIKIEPNAKSFFIPNYKLPISRREIINAKVEEMKRDDIVRESNSPYNSPLLLVPKKDGDWRLVVDYRQLNKQTIPDRFPIPVINDVLAQLGGAKVFTSLDLLSGYWQVPLSEE